MTDYSKLLSKKFIEARKEKGFSQKEVSEGICFQAQISRLEKGGYMPGAEILYLLAKRLEKPVEYFFEDINITEKSVRITKKLINEYLYRRDYKGLEKFIEVYFNGEEQYEEEEVLKEWAEAAVLANVYNRYDEAIEKLEKALSKINPHHPHYLDIVNGLYIKYSKIENYDKAQALIEPIKEEIFNVDFMDLNKALMQLKLSYNYLKQLELHHRQEEALPIVNQLIEEQIQAGFIISLAEFYVLHGNIMEYYNNKEKELSDYQKAITIFELLGNEKMALEGKRYIEENF